MRNLLITTFGEYNHLDSWLKGSRNFDVALINYDSHEHRNDLISDCVYLDTFHTFKFPGIWDAFWDEPSLLMYDYFWMPDTDIDVSCDDINKMFDKVKTLKLDLSQPSIEKSNTSFPSWEYFIHKDDLDVIMTNFVEVMCPVFSRSALDKCLATFRKSQSGWGLDLVWAKLVNNGNNMAIINSIIVKHTRPVKGGDLYKALSDKRISPSGDRRRLMKEYGVSSINIETWI